jgi:hypothetical protein
MVLARFRKDLRVMIDTGLVIIFIIILFGLYLVLGLLQPGNKVGRIKSILKVIKE